MVKRLLSYSEKRGSIGDHFRAKRFLFFEKCIRQLEKPIRILDVGGTLSFWANRSYENKSGVYITILNLSTEEVSSTNIRSIRGDATDLSQFAEKSFDIVFSNSVIEHLYTFENQEKMASECMRVADYFFIQTPNKYFFIEPHFRLPFFNFLPKAVALRILTKTNLSLGKKWTPKEANQTLAEIRLLSKSEFLSLFDAPELYTERFLLLRKSFTLHNFSIGV